MQVHHDLKPIKCFIKNRYLYNLESDHDDYYEASKCRIFSISCYTAKAPTFQILIEDKYMFSDIPIHALYLSEYSALDYNQFCEVKDLCFSDSPDDNIVINYHQHLMNIESCSVWSKERKFIGHGKYICTIDWIDTNQNLHLISMGDRLMLWPSHKLVFGSDVPKELPDYKKLRHTWKVK